MTETLLQQQPSNIIHAIPGRVRFRLHQLIESKKYADKLHQLLHSDRHVKRVHINRVTASVVIYYQTKGLHDEKVIFYLATLTQTVTVIEIEEEKPQSLLRSSKEGEWKGLRIPAIATIFAMLRNYTKIPIPTSLTIAALGLAVLPVAQRAFKSLWVDRRLNIDCLDFLALSMSFLQGKILTPALVITLHELGDIIREQTARSTEIQTADLFDTIGRFAWVQRDGEILKIESDSVQRGETVIVYPGEQIPVDGKVTEGKATVDRSSLTGESMPVVAEAGTMVYASELLRSGELYIEAMRIGNKTRAAASLELLENAPVYDTRAENYAAKIADKLILPSLVLAGIVLTTTGDPARAASILTLDFVTGIRVSMPTAFLGALNHTTRHGVVVRSGRTIEQLAEIDTIVFDKTGTLTQGDLAVVGVQTVDGGISQEKLLQLAASAEQRLTHPVAEAIANYAQKQQIQILPRGQWDYKVGLGLTAEIDGQQVLVGSAKFLKIEGIDLNGSQDRPNGLSVVYVACNGKFMGAIEYADPLRPETSFLIRQLQHKYAMEIHILTGDNEQRAIEVAKQLNIPLSQVHAEAFPETKAAIVRDLHRSGKTVAMVGDGLNDSVALAYADVSVSFEDGSDVARETADVVLMNNDLTSFLETISIAQQTKKIIEENTVLVVGPNIVALGLASTVGLNPLLATVVHNGSAIAAGLNSLYPLVQHQLETK
ncbi:MAG: heavy metal translocating P-type ATPase [Prochloraceae cyanobacterium]|nr:heavy metal translocating P-type ATPase [Prochloraceae cyanobacterium]